MVILGLEEIANHVNSHCSAIVNTSRHEMIVGEKVRMQKALPEVPVLNWNSVMHKNVRTKDGEPLGYIASEDNGFILILASGFRQYRIPKPHVEAFDGSQVFLDLEFGEVSRYKID